MSEIKQVKVDNWGIYFLQRLKHFFNRTDYCDLTLQFQDNAQLKVHRLVLSACTEYFELLERTCEMYEDCLVMPDDLQADVVVPIVNFMYTGQLEFKMDLLERLYQTSQIMNMPVLTKLLNAQRSYTTVPNRFQNSSGVKHYSKSSSIRLPSKQTTPQLSNISSTSKSGNKRTFTKAFEKPEIIPEIKTPYHHEAFPSKRKILVDPRPTRYELPEELDGDNVFESSFSSLSYDSKPLMIHPETKQYSSKKSKFFNSVSSSKNFFGGTSTLDIVECKRVRKNDNIFDDSECDMTTDDLGVFSSNMLNVRDEVPDSNQLFDKIMDNEDGPKVTIETKDSKKAGKIDHAKIISEVLKKYPHLVKSNKNIKLKILDTPQKSKPKFVKEEKLESPKGESDYTFESDVLDSQAAAKLIAQGAENTTGPWICLICGTPGKALHFSSYFKFRRHLVEVHHEKPIVNMCEYCGLKSYKRNYMLHHIYTKHGIEPPPQYKFPKCNLCNYVALTEGYLIKHKMSHSDSKNFRCNVCSVAFSTTRQLLSHIQVSGHKYSAEKKTNLQCIYCMKQFLRETNLYTHLKINHKREAKIDGIIDDSDEEEEKPVIKPNQESRPSPIKYEPLSTLDIEYEDDQTYQIQEKPENNFQVTKKLFAQTPSKQKILNPGFSTPITKAVPKTKPVQNMPSIHSEFLEDSHIPSPENNQNEEVIIIGENEYIIRDNQLIPRKGKIKNDYVIPDVLPEEENETVATSTSSISYNNLHHINYQETLPQTQSKVLKKPMPEINQPIQIVVSNEEEYKALMASNHPIMFDDTNTGKTLTVLTTPHTTQLNTAGLSLENAQSNDMMIIQQEYQMTPISETVPIDNSNIVVVYSHSADHQNKPYQLITSQGLGGQIIQSSAMITPNYGAMTTATPVMSAQIIDHHAQIWNNDVHHDIGNHEVEISSEQQYHEMAVAEQTEITATDNETNLEQLPEVHLMHEETQTMSSNEIEGNINQTTDISNVNITHTIPATIIEETQSIPVIKDHNLAEAAMDIVHNCTPVNIAVQSEVSTFDLSNTTANIGEHTELTYLQNTVEESIVTPQEQTQSENIQGQAPQDTNCSTEIPPSQVDNNNISTGECAAIDNDEETSMTQNNSQGYSQVAVIVPPVTPKTKEQIQNLTSEWSDEDEVTTPAERTDQDEAPSKLEEPVENNQKISQNTVVENIGIAKPINENNEPESQESEQCIVDKTLEPVNAPLEKISSLLNDWEENDSQEENHPESESTLPSLNEKEQPQCQDESGSNDVTNGNESIGKEKEDTTIISNVKTDKIRSLVSDWDEDDEEKKE